MSMPSSDPDGMIAGFQQQIEAKMQQAQQLQDAATGVQVSSSHRDGSVTVVVDHSGNMSERIRHRGTDRPAIDVYKPLAAGEAKLIEAAPTAASAVGAAVSGAGIAVQVVRTTVRDLIASAMSDLVQYLARSAIAAGVTLGLATPVLVADGIRIVARWSTRAAEWLKKIVRSSQKLAEIVQRVKPALSKVQDTLGPVTNTAKSAQGWASGKSLSDLTTAQQFARNPAALGATYEDQDYAKDATGNEL
ncbi:hypothetical protein FHX42_004313 [Saccharopolyspora lacisalsi]|uniref:Uncharacterized protein n=1 Tax=Halosaccharopolyspora lacisalsi TaxID=1000566 RepID=A0A839DZJ7_9PSEU|nr:hypothetical protein [Halosaccharopolyspora lacisalsi]MBA8826934.1 hypothetical protein [Halosaccharopolyspora lacisalsi]